MIQQAKFNYFSLGNAFEKQTKTIKDQGEKQIKAIQTQEQIKTFKKSTFFFFFLFTLFRIGLKIALQLQ